jgi:hypothetical protein
MILYIIIDFSVTIYVYMLMRIKFIHSFKIKVCNYCTFAPLDGITINEYGIVLRATCLIDIQKVNSVFLLAI